MKKYKNIHTGNVKTKKQWIRQFEECRENGEPEATEAFKIFVCNGDLKEVHTW